MKEFIIANYEVFIMFGVLFFGLGLGFGLIPYLKKKELIVQKDINNTQHIINLSLLVLKEINKKPDRKSDIELINNIIDTIFNYIEDNFKEKSNEEKIKLANNFTIEILKKLGIELTDQRKILIEGALNSFYKIIY